MKEIKLVCGHKVKVRINRNDEKLAEWYKHNYFCLQCERDRKARERKEREDICIEYGLFSNKLEGSEGNRKIAKEIKMKYGYQLIQLNPENLDKYIEALKAKTKATWFLARADYSIEKFMQALLGEEERANIISPEKVIDEDIIVNLTYEGDMIVARFIYQEMIPGILKRIGWSWDVDLRRWFFKIDDMSGTAADRMAEAGHKLLKAGFIVEIEDKGIAERAIKGEYISRHKRWITAGEKCFSIKIEYGDCIKEKIKKMGGQWNIVDKMWEVPLSYYKTILEFEDKEGFRLTAIAHLRVAEQEKLYQWSIGTPIGDHIDKKEAVSVDPLSDLRDE